MTTPTGTITMLDVILELDGVATPRQIALNDADVRGLAEVPAGQISMDDLRGKSAINTLVTGDVTVGEALFVGFGFSVSTLTGSVANVVGYGNFAGTTVDEVVSFSSNGALKFATLTAGDLSTELNTIRIFGNGIDVTLPFTIFSSGTPTKSAGQTANGYYTWDGDDIGKTYGFEVVGL